nr:EOG090X0FQ9 [Polyphemus pediculus]
MLPLKNITYLSYYPKNVFLNISRGKKVWVRKPMGLPMAKSKQFKIPVKPNLPEDEKREIKRLYDRYKTEMKSLQRYFFEQSLKLADSGESSQLKLRQEEEEHQRLMMENQLENEKTAKLREQRLAAEFEETKEKVLRSLIRKEKENESLHADLLTFVKEQEALPFIKKEDIETAIETALANPVNFNFAIDLQGYVYRGKETNLSDIPEEKRERLCN